jgi:flagellar biosynthesis/type III secretory pathway protein FliH
MRARKRLYARAKRTAETEVAKTRAALLQAHAAELDTLRNRARRELSELALAIAEHVLAQELSESSRALIRRLDATLGALPDMPAQIYVNPRDVAEVSALTSSRDLATSSSSEVIADPRHTPGSALILTREGSIEIEWASRFEAILTEIHSATGPSRSPV